MPIELAPLSSNEFSDFMASLRQRYVHDRMESNLLSQAEAERFTDQQWATILPEGSETEGHFFFALINGNRSIGSSWLHVDANSKSAFIFELFLDADARGKGFGRASLLALETFAKDYGARTLGLNVFAANERARKLYDSFGFAPVSTDMVKPI